MATVVLDGVRSVFPVTKECTYLNTASVAPLSTLARAAMTRQVRDQCAHGGANHSEWFACYDRCRSRLAELISATTAEIAVVANAAAGIGTIARGLRARPGANVVLAESVDAVVWAALPDVEVRVVPRRAGGLAVDDVAERVDERTAAVAVDFVDAATGHRADLASLGAIARAEGALFAVDASHGLGALPLDAAAFGIDALVADGHRWVCGPEGVGVLHVRREARERIAPARPVRTDWTPTRVVAAPPTARRYEEGAPNTCGIFGFEAALGLVLDLGVDAIAERVLHLSAYLREGARARDIGLACAADGDEASGIVALRLDDADVFATALEQRRIYVGARDGHLLVSLHHFNTEDELDRLLEAFQ